VLILQRKFSDEQLLTLHGLNLSDREIAKRFNCVPGAVCQRRHKLKLPTTQIRYPNVVFLNNFDKGYIIGLIEGEGTLSIQKRFRYEMKNFNRTKHIEYIPYISIANTNRQLLEYAQTILGGRIYKDSSRGEKWKPKYVLHIGGQKRLIGLLSAIAEHFIVKKQHALLLLEFCESRLPKQRLASNLKRYNQREIEIVDIIRKLNQRKRETKK